MKARIASFFNLRQASYIRKWITRSILIGIAAGLGSIVFYWSIGQVTRLALGAGAGYMPPVPAGERVTIISLITRR